MTLAEIEREPLCELAYCPAPTDPDWHVCAHCGGTTIEHHHTKGRGKTLTLDVRWVFPWCPEVHKKISNHEWKDGHIELPGEPVRYYVLDLRGETVYDEAPPWMQATDEGGGAQSKRAGLSGTPVKAIPPPPLPVASSADMDAGSSTEFAPLATAIPASLPVAYDFKDFDAWAEQGQRLGRVIADIPWAVGDWIVYGEDAFGEKASQHIEELGMPVERLSSYAWVARQIPPSDRRAGLKWSHHRAAARLPAPERNEVLDNAVSGAQTVKEIVAAVQEREPAITRVKCGGVCSSCGAECGRVTS